METLKLSQIIPDKNQPRKYFQVEKMASLKASIKRQGIVQPLIVQKLGKNYLLVDGERRFRVAQELGLKEVPVHIVEEKGDFDRLIEQFHVQEQHESWTPVEKALAVLEIVKVSGKSLQEVCEMLSVTERTVRTYTAFASLQNKEKFVQHQLNLSNAEGIREIKSFARNIKEKVLEESFTKADENRMEKLLIEKVRDGEINTHRGYTRIKDSFRSNPKLVDEFMEGKFDIDTKYVESNAKGSAYVRNMIVSCNYVISNGNGFLRNPSVKLTDNDLAILERTKEVVEKVLKLG